MWAKQKQLGFTIVELLIVIVIIAILAATTVVAFNGIQTRAKNVSQSGAAAQYIKMLRLYKIQNGEWPTESGCLGENNTDTNGNGVKDCGEDGSTEVNPTLLTKLRTVGTLPNVITDQIQGTSGIKSAGIRYWGVLVDGRALITWYVKGSSSDCKPPSGNTDEFVPGNDGQRVWCQLYMRNE
ncbi:MAG TPA: prepilin-type N-terminal cleavage/methylation domain-containing protein [Candidatus Saccharimonadales bacterium]